MSVPAKRRSRSRLRRGRAHAALISQNLQKCSNCGKMKKSHRVCPSCGYYKGKEVVKKKTKKKKS